MTTNQRLGYFGLLDDHIKASRARDRDGIVGAKFDQRDAEAITDIVLSDPARYGL